MQTDKNNKFVLFFVCDFEKLGKQKMEKKSKAVNNKLLSSFRKVHLLVIYRITNQIRKI